MHFLQFNKLNKFKQISIIIMALIRSPAFFLSSQLSFSLPLSICFCGIKQTVSFLCAPCTSLCVCVCVCRGHSAKRGTGMERSQSSTWESGEESRNKLVKAASTSKLLAKVVKNADK